jgi:hypothetical protein
MDVGRTALTDGQSADAATRTAAIRPAGAPKPWHKPCFTALMTTTTTLRTVARAAMVAWILGSTSAMAQPYIGAHVGYADGEFTLSEPYNGTVDDRSMMLGVSGGFGFGRKWAIEGAAHIYEGFDGRATPCPAGQLCGPIVEAVDDNDLTVYRLALVRRAFIGKAQVYGQAGYYHARLDTRIPLPGDDFTENGLVLAAGIRWQIREPWDVSVEVSRLDNHVAQLTVGMGMGIRPRTERRAR